jgi:hypothetical protein
MLTTAALSLALPLVLPSTWPLGNTFGARGGPSDFPIAHTRRASELSAAPDILRDAQVFDGDAVTFLGPSDMIGDRTDYGRPTAAELMGYGNLPQDWDGQGAEAPSSLAISNALRMLEITPVGIEAPKPMLLASGEVALYWDFGEVYAEIGFDQAGNYYAFATRPGFESVYLDDILFDGDSINPEFPAAVRGLLTWAPLKAAA